jgi:hypothetical protein
MKILLSLTAAILILSGCTASPPAAGPLPGQPETLVPIKTLGLLTPTPQQIPPNLGTTQTPDGAYPAPLSTRTDAPGIISNQTPDAQKDRRISTPPQASLHIGDRSQAGAIGATCWQAEQHAGKPVEATCADALGVPTALDPLPARSPLSAAFDLALASLPDKLALSISKVSPADELKGMPASQRWWSPPSAQPLSLELSAHPATQLRLDPGLYLFALYARWSPQGDVTYGFLVEIQ